MSTTKQLLKFEQLFDDDGIDNIYEWVAGQAVAANL